MASITNLHILGIIICFIFAMPVLNNRISNTESFCSSFFCGDHGHSKSIVDNGTCKCNRQNYLVNIECPKWNPEPLTANFYWRFYNNGKVIVNGINNEIPSKFLSNLLSCLTGFPSITVTNFCRLNTNISDVNAIEIIDKHFHLNLKILKLPNNCIESITSGIGENYPNLIELDLSFNRLTTIPKLKNQLKWLRKFDASHNFISNISNYILKSFIACEILNLSHNKLSILPIDLLNDLNHLKVLDLSYNSILTLPVISKQRLERLYLNNNNLTFIPDNYFSECGDLIYLDLSDNNLINISVLNFLPMKKLKILNLNNLGISELNSQLQTLPNIERISLTGNAFTTVPSSLLINSENIFLDFRFNKIFFLYLPFISPLNSLEKLSLDISHNCIQMIGNALLGSISIHTFKCSFCCLDHIDPRMFVGLTDQLDLSYNNITELNLTGFNILPNDSQIINLNVSHNQISRLANKDYELWSKISFLDISHNNLVSLENLTITSNLDKLYLNNNSLTEFSGVIITLLSCNVSVKLAGNPWECNCEVQNRVFRSPLVTDKHSITCVNEGITYTFSDFHQLCKTPSLLLLIMPIIISVIITSALIIFYYKFKRQIVYFIYSRGICQRFLSKEDVDSDKIYDAFVSYSYEDEDWVADFLVPGLETGKPAYKLCISNRDWLGGVFIPDQIVKSVESSRRTIIVLTENFVKSVWGRMEFEVAYRQAIDDKMPRLIVVLPNDVPDLTGLSKELKTFVTVTSYIQANKPHFWMKLRASMGRTKKPKRMKSSKK